MNRYCIVTYHYIREGDGLHGCAPELFRSQLDHIKNAYAVLSLPELYLAAKEGREGSFCALTFDDGCKEHVSVALPELQKRNMSGTFFVIGSTLTERRITMTHKLHFILPRMASVSIAAFLRDFSSGRIVVPEDQRMNPKRRFDDVVTANLKEVLIRMPIDERAAFIDAVWEKIGIDESSIADEFFMDVKDVRALCGAGMDVASHTYSHLGLDVISKEDQRREIERGQDALESVVHERSPLFSYPNGRYTEETFDILREREIQLAVILGARDVGREDHPLALPRFDANDIKKGV